MNTEREFNFNEHDLLFMYNLITKYRIRGKISIEIYPPNQEMILLKKNNIQTIIQYKLKQLQIKNWTQIYIKKTYKIAQSNEIMLYYWQLDQMLNYFSQNKILESFYNICQYRNYLNTSDGYCIDYQLTSGDSRLISKKENNYYIKKLKTI